jgi:hypothetical protein
MNLSAILHLLGPELCSLCASVVRRTPDSHAQSMRRGHAQLSRNRPLIRSPGSGPGRTMSQTRTTGGRLIGITGTASAKVRHAYARLERLGLRREAKCHAAFPHARCMTHSIHLVRSKAVSPLRSATAVQNARHIHVPPAFCFDKTRRSLWHVRRQFQFNS